jgi:hypothetical protein
VAHRVRDAGAGGRFHRRPATSTSTRAGFRIGIAGLVVVLVVVLGWHAEVLSRRAVTDVVGDERHPGAVALLTGMPEQAPVLPPPVSMYEDWVRIEHWDCTPLARFPMDTCAQPVAAPPPSASSSPAIRTSSSSPGR